MNHIDNFFHFYETTEAFIAHKKLQAISPDSVCFLGETGQIFTQNTFFGICRKRYEELELKVLEHEVKIRDILGIEGSSVNDGAINNIADIFNFLGGFGEDESLKEVISNIKTALENQIAEVLNTLSSRMDKLETELTSEFDIVKTQVSDVITRQDNVEATVTNLNNRITTHLREFQDLYDNFNYFRSYTDSKFTAVNNSISAVNSTVTNIQETVFELESRLDSIQSTISTLNSLIEEVRNLSNELEGRFGDTLADIEEFKREVNRRISEFTATKGQSNGIAPLDSNGLIASQYLPSYVDDVLEYATRNAFPLTGETGKIYVALDDNITYRWSGSTYIEISKSLGLGETASTAYPGNKGKKNADDITAHKTDTNNPHNVTKAQLGLDKVNNTADLDKPVSTAVQALIDVVTNSVLAHIEDKANPHKVTKEQIGLGNVDNTSDADKPISPVVENILNTKVDKVIGKGLSTNDFTNDDKDKLDNSMSSKKLTSTQLENYTTPGIGEIVYNTTSNEYVYWNGTEWVSMTPKAISDSELEAILV